MRYGINLLLWTDVLDDKSLPVLDLVQRIGYDLVELPIMSDEPVGPKKWGKRLDELGLKRTASHCTPPEHNLISSDSSVRRAGVEGLKRILDRCAEAGVETLMGPIHSAIGVFSGQAATKDEWQWGVECMRQVAEYAQTINVRIAIEYLNRFECYFLTCAADLARYVKAVDHPFCGGVFDTFHAHIEEKNSAAAVRELGKHITHVHISENDRGTPGEGAVHWNPVFDALHDVGYEGNMVVEAFGSQLPSLTAATKIWRKMFRSEEQLATDALAFMKENVARRWG